MPCACWSGSCNPGLPGKEVIGMRVSTQLHAALMVIAHP